MDDPEVPYLKTSAYEWTARAFEMLEAGTLIAAVLATDAIISTRVEGPCPRCTHHLSDRQTASAVSSTLPGERGVADADVMGDVVQIDVTCACGHPHAGAPEAAQSCGASFRIKFEVDETA
ncbi:hypothetical protein [Microtetraspora sp. NBRC 16547]|uniref:hypothetical protein n=1 Tax=Microtetraspora sp. NBRC 16547 TaxID=3030993 RepID=UPI0024A4D792|nr:hypothetical protein [Microtetraspora sp. NBRC 16547]GLW98813.1 hypothetical protein Misp02_29000 [Microtetraspora sp. NBRC 16547]